MNTWQEDHKNQRINYSNKTEFTENIGADNNDIITEAEEVSEA